MTLPIVLVVDDNATTRRFIHAVLRHENVEIVEAVSARAALQAAKTCRPDIVLLDIMLPDGSGFDLVAPLRDALGAPVPVLAVTGLISRADEGRLGSAGFDDIVHKPIDPVRLRAALRAFLPERASSQVAIGAGKKLVYVDDDPVQRKLAAFRLSRIGFEVFQAGDATQALELTRTKQPDIVVSDVLMPGIDGFQLCSLIRGDPQVARIPVILITNSYLEEDDRVLASKIGADGYVIRSHDLRELISSLDSLGSGGERGSYVSAVEVSGTGTDRLVRAAHQLDRQLGLNVALTQRTAVLSAQLKILGGLTNTLLEDGDVESALDQALHACLDAGGISWGLLFVKDRHEWTSRTLGLTDVERRVAKSSLDTVIEALQRGSRARAPIRMEGSLVGLEIGSVALVVPVARKDELLGAIVLRLSPTLDEQRVAFIQVIAGQLALVIALARTFQRLDDTSKAERARARLLASTVDAIASPLLVVDAAGKASRWNASGEAYRFLTNAGRDPGKTVLNAEQTRVLEWADGPIGRAIAGAEVDDVEVCVRCEANETRWLRITARAFHDDESRTAGAVAVIRDITEDRRAQARLVVNDRLASIGVLAAGVAHEINNPLTSVIAEIEMGVQTIHTPDGAVEHLETALDAAHRVRTIVSDLRNLSRDSAEDAASSVDLARVIDTAVRLAGPHSRAARVTVSPWVDRPPQVTGNEGRLVQVFLNLIVNAVQAMPEELPLERRVVTIRAERGRDRGARVEVVDTGTGMSPEVRDRIFTPFFTTKPPGTGTGLGLSISQRIITQLSGTIDCDSAPGVGTTFSIWLPAAADNDLRRSGPRPAVSETPRRRVLVVADPFVRQTVTRALRADNEVIALGSGAQAWARLEAGEPFDLVIYDAHAPDIDAASLLARLGDSPLAQRFIVVHGKTSNPEVRERLTQRGVPTLEKPLQPAPLIALANRVWTGFARP